MLKQLSLIGLLSICLLGCEQAVDPTVAVYIHSIGKSESGKQWYEVGPTPKEPTEQNQTGKQVCSGPKGLKVGQKVYLGKATYGSPLEFIIAVAEE
ncbi:MAG: hypothetical protein DWQ19_11370 [Crenarchaeota archaeon]|nr:MAG: hypothetical protein DWQ19_11370 [Thermoproteota archaeon]